MEYPTTLEPYSTKVSRHTCPQCNTKYSLSLYINTNTGEYINPIVGRCNREVKCGYHYKPKQYFLDNNISNDVALSASYKSKPVKTHTYIPINLLQDSLNGFEENRFVLFLIKLFGEVKTEKLISNYFIGTSNDCYRKETGNWVGATVFWFIDIRGRIHAGQVKQFDDTGHTAKYTDKDGNTSSCTDGIHTPLKWSYKKQREELPEWLSNYVEGKKITCFFGEHLLQDTTKTIAVVESPKTAIIASAYLPQFTWIAVGALSYLTEDRCQVLSGRKVILYPDLSKKESDKQTTYEKWCAKAKELAHITDFKVSNLLESKATDYEREKGLDLADFLIRIPFQDTKDTSQKQELPLNPKQEDLDAPIPVNNISSIILNAKNS